MSFKIFLSAQKAAHDAKGDFIRLSVSDPNLPDASSWAEVEAYISRHHDNPIITDAGLSLWKDYEKAEKKARGS